jgi:ABC-2 type transport system permease protein
VLVVYGLAMHVRGTIESLNDQLTGPVGTVAGWLPPGAGARAIIAARDGNWADFGARLAVMLLMTAVAVLAWAWSLSRRVRGDISSQGAGYRRSVTDPLPLVPKAIAWLPAGEASAAAAQQLRYFFFRSPKAIQTLLIPPVMGMMVAHSTFGQLGVPAQAAAFAALAVVVGSFNVFGYDGPGFRYLALSATSMAKVLWGKVLAPLVYLVPLLAGYVIVEVLLQGTLAQAPLAFCAGASVFATGLGIGAQSSIRNPNDQSTIGHRQGMFLKVFSWFMGFFLTASVGAGIWVALARWFSQGVAAAVMLPVSIVFASISISAAGRRLDRDPSAVLAKLAPQAF